jgi:RHS repeat-associated protein
MCWPGPSGTLTESDLTGTINEEYIYFNGERIARVDRPSGGVHYYFSNHLGSHTMVTSATGSCEQDVDYFPYGGEITDHCPNVAQHYKFTGKERDTESGLDNFEARYFASTMGRFLTPDWAARPTSVPYAVFGDPQSLNLYGYVRNDPVTLADADGHDPPVPMGPLEDNSGTTYNEEMAQTITGKEEKQAQNQTLSTNGLQFIEKHEGYSGTVYKDSAGNPTIGYGHLIKDGEDFSKGITKEKAGELLAQDTKTAVDAVNSKVTTSLSQTKFDAVVDFTYNLGGGNLGKSTLLKNINAGKDVTENNFTDWNRAGGKVVNGLTIRRTDEFNLFSKGDYGGP